MSIDASSALALAAEFETVGAALPAEAQSLVLHYGALLHAAIVSRAPGTNYPGTIGIQGFARGPIVGIAVGTDRLDGFRREIGYHGQDRLGRHYSESGHAHFAPGFAEVEPDFLAATARLGEP